MRNVEKRISTEEFSKVLLTKSDLRELLKKIQMENELLEVQVGDVVLESVEEMISHEASLTFPMRIDLGKLTIKFDDYRNQIYGPPEENNRIKIIAAEINRFRNPFRWMSSLIGFIILSIVLNGFGFALISLLFKFIFIEQGLEHRAAVLFISMLVAFFGSIKLGNLSENRFSNTGSDTFVRKYSEKIIPPVASSLATAGLIWLVANWEKFQAIISSTPTNP